MYNVAKLRQESFITKFLKYLKKHPLEKAKCRATHPHEKSTRPTTTEKTEPYLRSSAHCPKNLHGMKTKNLFPLLLPRNLKKPLLTRRFSGRARESIARFSRASNDDGPSTFQRGA